MFLTEHTIAHSVKVANIMSLLAPTYHLIPTHMYILGLLHDIGKLNTEGTKIELKKSEGHAYKGGELLKGLDFPYWQEVFFHGHPEHGYKSPAMDLLMINAFAEVQLSMTQDNNIPNDSKWQFHTINLYMGDDYEIVRNTLTVEQFKAGKLITPSMEDFEFAGWYTAPDGGTLVTADSDFTSIYKLYARWNYVGDDDDEDYDDDWYEDYEDDDDFWDEIDEPIEDDGTTVRDYVETEKEVKEDLDDALELLDKINTETIKKTGIDSPSGGAISLLQKDNLNGDIKIGRYISDSIVDGQGNQITDKVFVTDTGRIGINLGKLDYLTPSLLKTLNGVDADIELYFMYKGKLTRLIIPKGTDLSKYVDKNGFIGLLYLRQLIEIGQLI